MAIKQSFVAFFFFLKWGLGVRQPGWDIEGGAQEKKFGNRCTKALESPYASDTCWSNIINAA